MTARFTVGNHDLCHPYFVATAQAVERMDMVALTADSITRAADETWGTAIATATAPTLADIALAYGSGLTNAATGVKVAYLTPWGEGTLSSVGSGTPTANGALELAAVALPTNVIGLAVYVETAAASGVYKLYTVTQGQQIAITGYGIGRVPPTAVLTAETAVTQYSFCQKFAGVSNQRKVTLLARIFGNSEDNLIMVARGGVVEFDCVSASFAAGDFVGPAKDTGNTLLNQTVVAVPHPALAVGRVVRRYTSVTKVEVEILSAKKPVHQNVVAYGNAT